MYPLLWQRNHRNVVSWYHENGVLDPLWMAVVNKERRGYYLIGHKGDMLELPFVVA